MRDSILKRAVVLVVDDHPDTLHLLIDALESAGVTVLVATDGRQALEQIGRLMPDLILLDAVMPGMDGFETCRALKAGAAADVPVIFMTGLEETEHIVRGLEAGGTDYLTKPIAPSELLARMRVHLATAREAHGVRTALDVSGRTMLATDAHGNIRWATPQAEQILAKLAGDGAPLADRSAVSSDAIRTPPIELPPAVRTWVSSNASSSKPMPNESIVVTSPELKIRFRLLSRVADDEILLFLQQAEPVQVERTAIRKLQNRFSLTAREAEVLYWLSFGKSNRDIATILGISLRTADKHLEHVYTKLGVESRSGAAAASVRAFEE
ncbi:MAG: two component transcriptional regulator, LuxR family [Betaproteobacteria bacterium]|nr:two component transcriptional regulator, LuxR family [Betaproteobacteria bacterium]